jgi:hypothetical protein
MDFWLLTIYYFINGITNGMKKSGGVLEIFSAEWKFQRNFTNGIIDDYLKIIKFNILLVSLSVKHSIKTQ